jgi:hypothetical protein
LTLPAVELFPTVARNVRRIGPLATLAIVVRALWYWPAWGVRRWWRRPARRHVERTPW